MTRTDLRGRRLSARELAAALPRPELDVAHAAVQVAPIVAHMPRRPCASNSTRRGSPVSVIAPAVAPWYER